MQTQTHARTTTARKRTPVKTKAKAKTKTAVKAKAKTAVKAKAKKAKKPEVNALDQLAAAMAEQGLLGKLRTGMSLLMFGEVTLPPSTKRH